MDNQQNRTVIGTKSINGELFTENCKVQIVDNQNQIIAELFVGLAKADTGADVQLIVDQENALTVNALQTFPYSVTNLTFGNQQTLQARELEISYFLLFDVGGEYVKVGKKLSNLILIPRTQENVQQKTILGMRNESSQISIQSRFEGIIL